MNYQKQATKDNFLANNQSLFDESKIKEVNDFKLSAKPESSEAGESTTSSETTASGSFFAGIDSEADFNSMITYLKETKANLDKSAAPDEIKNEVSQLSQDLGEMITLCEKYSGLINYLFKASEAFASLNSKLSSENIASANADTINAEVDQIKSTLSSMEVPAEAQELNTLFINDIEALRNYLVAVITQAAAVSSLQAPAADASTEELMEYLAQAQALTESLNNVPAAPTLSVTSFDFDKLFPESDNTKLEELGNRIEVNYEVISNFYGK